MVNLSVIFQSCKFWSVSASPSFFVRFVPSAIFLSVNFQSVNFQYVIFYPCNFVRHFPVLYAYYPLLRSRPSIDSSSFSTYATSSSFASPAFSSPANSTQRFHPRPYYTDIDRLLNRQTKCFNVSFSKHKRYSQRRIKPSISK